MVVNKKTKICPDCQLKIGAKTRTCKCGHKFIFTKIYKGKKCVQCQKDLKKRSKKCDGCGYIYPVKNNKKFEEIPKGEWRKLKRHEIFYIGKGGAGPYFITTFDHTPEVLKNTKILLGHRGKFKVLKIEKDGIVAYSSSGCCYIYMGKTCICEKTGITKKKYRLHKKCITTK